IGVNGGLAISKNATDTVDLNGNNFFPNSWTFPYGSNRRGGRSDTAYGLGATRMPGNFFAPFWADLLAYYDTIGSFHSHIRFERGYLGDTCVVIVEWDSLGAYSYEYGSQTDNITFRAIFNKCDGTIEYQYDNVGA